MTSKKAKNFYGAFGARLRRGPSALAFGHHQLLPVQLLPPGGMIDSAHFPATYALVIGGWLPCLGGLLCDVQGLGDGALGR